MTRTISAAAVILAAGTALLTVPAFAADLPTTVAPPSWTGPYVGAQIGGAVGGETDNLSSILPTPADSYGLSGLLGGVYAGYNIQSDNLVYGVEGVINYSGLTGTNTFTTPLPGSLKFNSDWQGAIKARLGVVDDETLFYATAGFAVAYGTETLTLTSPPPITASASATHTGWTIGAGAERPIAPNLTIRAELDYTAFGAQNYTGFAGGGSGTMQASWAQTTAMVGLSYKF